MTNVSYFYTISHTSDGINQKNKITEPFATTLVHLTKR